jgi:hypothetical protein
MKIPRFWNRNGFALVSTSRKSKWRSRNLGNPVQQPGNENSAILESKWFRVGFHLS